MNRFFWLLAFLLVCLGAVNPILAAPASALAFSSDGAFLASGAHRRIEIRSVPSGEVFTRLPADLGRLCSISFSADNQRLAVAGGIPGESGATIIINWKDKSDLHRFTNFSDLITSAAFNRDASWIALASADHSALLVSIPPGRSNSPIALRGHSGPVLGVAWSPQDDLVVTASADRSLKIWSSVDGKLLRSFSHHTEPVHAVVFRPSTNAISAQPVQCASASDDATVRIWQPQIGRMVRIIRGHDGPIFALAYAPDGQSLYSAGKEGVIRRLDADSDEIIGRWSAHNEAIYSLAISPDGTLLASGDWAGRVYLWKITAGELKKL